MKAQKELRDIATAGANTMFKLSDDGVDLELAAYILLRRAQRANDKHALPPFLPDGASLI